jgi:hypothetical protein
MMDALQDRSALIVDRRTRAVGRCPVISDRWTCSLTRLPSRAYHAPCKFYDTFGEDVTNELVDWFNSVDATYRADLRELADLQYARFEARLEQRIAELKTAVADLKSDLVKWMFAFWAPTALAVVALLLRK